MANSIYDFSITGIDGKETPLSTYKGKVLLITNVASKCGFTYQYEGLEKLHKNLGTKGFAVLGFPCNQFGAQEPGDAAEIQNFCKLSYGVSFPLSQKIDVNGPDTHPLYRFLKGQKRGLLWTSAIKWNFTKFLVDREGRVVARFGPRDKPEDLEQRILDLL